MRGAVVLKRGAVAERAVELVAARHGRGLRAVHGAEHEPLFEPVAEEQAQHLIPHVRQVESHVRAGSGDEHGEPPGDELRGHGVAELHPDSVLFRLAGHDKAHAGKFVHLHIHQ